MEKPLNTTKNKILRHAGKLFSQKGYFGTSMEDIAQLVGIKKPAIYYHFKSKEDIFTTLMEFAITELRKNLNNTVQEAETGHEIISNLITSITEFKLMYPEITILNTYNADVKGAEYIKTMQDNLVSIVSGVIKEAKDFRKLSQERLYTLGLVVTSFVFSPLPITNKEIELFSKSISSAQNYK